MLFRVYVFCIIGILDSGKHAEVHPKHSYEIEPDDCHDETASTVQLLCQQANWQQPKNDIAESSDEGES